MLFLCAQLPPHFIIFMCSCSLRDYIFLGIKKSPASIRLTILPHYACRVKHIFGLSQNFCAIKNVGKFSLAHIFSFHFIIIMYHRVLHNLGLLVNPQVLYSELILNVFLQRSFLHVRLLQLPHQEVLLNYVPLRLL